MRYVQILSCLTISSCLTGIVHAQGKLPPTSRTVYKCTTDGKVVYSDEPCLGAEKINAEPTRGLNQFTGNVQRGRDVQNEMNREAFAQAVRPLTGMDANQLAVESRRQQLTPDARRQCQKLDQDIQLGEAKERAVIGDERSQVQQVLFNNRALHKRIGC